MAMGEAVPLVSSNVASIAYDPDEQTLEVTFNSGAVYQYFAVDESVYMSFLAAPSPGRFLWQNLRGVYDYNRLA